MHSDGSASTSRHLYNEWMDGWMNVCETPTHTQIIINQSNNELKSNCLWRCLNIILEY